MKELLMSYSLQEIFLFLVIFALAIKGVTNFFDWGKDRLAKIFKKDNKVNTLEENIQTLINENKKTQEHFDKIHKTLDILISSDKDDIKSWIVEKHHFFYHSLKHIDNYSLDCIERRYSHYVEEGGNSYVEELMNELRSLPKVSPFAGQDAKE